MIEAVSRIGGCILEKSGREDPLTIYIENPNSNGKYNTVLLVLLKESGGEYFFSRVIMDEFKNDLGLYLYKKGSSRGTDITPTSKSAESLERTFRSKFLRWFANYNNYDLSDEDKHTLKKMNLAIDEQKDRILAELQEKYSERPSKDNAIITLGFEGDDDNSYSYLGEYPIFKKILIKESGKAYFIKKSLGESKGNRAACSVCREVKDEVFGFAIPWTFHTFDKPGFIAGGFNVNEAWKNTPVCFDCATSLEVGKKYIEEHLDFGFYGFRYLLIPKLAIARDDNETLNEVLSILGKNGEKNSQKITREFKTRITSDENEVLEFVKDQRDFFSNSLLFYKKEQSSYRILLLIDGILPSRLRDLFDAKEKVERRFKIYNDSILSEDQKEKSSLNFNFGVLRRFFPSESRNRTFNKMFLEIVDKIFVGDNISYHLLIDFIMNEVRKAFAKDYSTGIITLNGFLLLHYIKELDLFKSDTMEMKDMIDMTQKDGMPLSIEEIERLPLEQRIERFFEANRDFFDSHAKKATFLEGALTQMLLNIQYNDKKATPFRTKLHGLKLNQALIMRLLPEIQNKLEEYEKNYYRDLESQISMHFIQAGTDWEETDNELSFYFVLGMNLHKLFRNVKEEQEVREEA